MKKICKKIIITAMFIAVSGGTSGELNAIDTLTAGQCPSAGKSTLYKVLTDPIVV